MTNYQARVNILKFPFIFLKKSILKFTIVILFCQVATAQTYNLNADSTLFENPSPNYTLPEIYHTVGAISTVSGNTLNAVAVASPDHGLQGRAAGVWARQTNAMPAGLVSLWIRGGGSWASNHQPLIIVDGVPLYHGSAFSQAGYPSPLSTLNPYDVVSIEIVKDATAAHYGMRGINGVVLINTLTGKSGKPTVSWDSYVGLADLPNTLLLMNARQYANFVNEEDNYDGRRPVYNDTEIEQFGKGTDWQESILRTAPLHQNHLAVSGGTTNTQYAVSGSFYQQLGVIENSDFRRYTFRINLDQRLSPRLTIRPKVTFSSSRSHLPPRGTITSALSYPPTLPVKDSTGQYTSVPGTVNPVMLVEGFSSQYNVSRWLGNIVLEYKVLDSLSFSLRMGGNFLRGEESIPTIDTPNKRQESTWLIEPTLTYPYARTKHRASISLGAAYQEYDSEYTQIAANDPSDFGYFSTLVSPFIGALNYSYDERYSLLFTARYDGTSRFIRSEKFGFFPALAAAWHISEEPFAQGSKKFDKLSLRASYGVTGSEIIPAGSYSLLTSYMVDTLSKTIQSYTLSYEKNRQWNVGLDGEILNSRISFTADAFLKTSSDLFLAAPIPTPSGFESPLRNVGSILNRGLELSLHTENMRGIFEWSSQFNLTYLQNKILDIGSVDKIGTRSSVPFITQANYMEKGASIGTFYGFIANGVFHDQTEINNANQANAKPGDIRYRDTGGNNGMPDGVISYNDQTELGNPIPEWIGGIENSLSFKNLTLDAFLYFSAGNDVLNAQRFRQWVYSIQSNQQTDVIERWTPDRPDSNISIRGNNNAISSIQVENASFIRLQNVTLSYQLFTKTKKLKTKIYISGQNLFTLTKYSGYDPEVNYYGQDGMRLGVDYDNYPRARTILLGCNLNL